MVSSLLVQKVRKCGLHGKKDWEDKKYVLYLQLICSDLREETEGEKLEREVEEQVEDELGRFLLSLVQGEDGLVSLVQGEDGPVSLLQGEEGPGDGVVVISTSKDLRDSL